MLVLLSLVAMTPVLAWEVTKIKTKTLPIAGEVTFTSSFHAADGETITITIWPANSSVTISDVQLVKVTPKPKQGGGSIDVSVVDDHDVNVTLHNTRVGKSTFHLWLYLSTGEHLGVNVQFGR
jgi:hypothetical protein